MWHLLQEALGGAHPAIGSWFHEETAAFQSLLSVSAFSLSFAQSVPVSVSVSVSVEIEAVQISRASLARREREIACEPEKTTQHSCITIL